ncbi:MAG: YdcF family protein [Acidobacteriia bacterium]|nr:YdcF family protein [Terriglobia bacterium]
MRRLVFILRYTALLTGAAVLLATLTPLGYWYALWLAGDWLSPPGGTLLVAGADMEDPETMGLTSYRRVFYARLYWRQGTFSHIILLGRDAAPAMRKWLVHEGVPAAALIEENASDSTLENVRGARNILADWKARTGSEKPAQPLVLLTSDYHCWRARRVFAAAGVDVIVQPVPDAAKRWSSWPARWGVCTDLAVESAKICWYFIRGWL